MKMKKRMISLLLALVTALQLVTPALALEGQEELGTGDAAAALEAPAAAAEATAVSADPADPADQEPPADPAQPDYLPLPEGMEEHYCLVYGEAEGWDSLAQAFLLAFPQEDTIFAYLAEENDVFEIDPLTGLIEAWKAGSALVDVTVTQGEEISLYQVEVTIGKGEQTIEGLPAEGFSLRYTGATHPWGEGITAPGKLSFSAEENGVLTVDPETGAVTETGVGTAAVTVTAGETDCYKAASASYQVTIAKGTQTITGRGNNYTVNLYPGLSYDWSNIKSTSGEPLIFASSAPRIVSIDEKGLMSQWDLGTAVITATAPETELYEEAVFTSTVKVVRGKAKITGIQSNYCVGYQYGHTYNWGKMAKIVGDGKVTFKSSNPKVISVDQKGILTQKGRGTAKITITVAGTERFAQHSFTSTIKVKKAQSISNLKSQYTVTYQAGKTYDYKKMSKLNGGGTLSFSSSDPEVAVIDAKTGILTVRGAGRTTVTVRASETGTYAPVSKTSVLVVNKRSVPIEGLIRTYRYDWEEGKIYDWAQDVRYSGDGEVTYTSENPEVISIEPGTGKLKLVGKGKAIVRVRSSETENCKAAIFSTTVYVGQEMPTISGLREEYGVTYASGKTYDFGVKIKYSGNGTISFASSDPNVVAIDGKTGMVEVVGPGEAVITVTAAETAEYREVKLLSRFIVRPNITVKQYDFSSSYKSGIFYKKLMAVTLTGSQRTNIQKIGLSQVGYQEGSSLSRLSGTGGGESNYTEYGRWYYNYVDGSDYFYRGAWCCMFVSWCANEANIPASIIPRRALVEYMDDAFKAQGNYYTLRQSKPGGGGKTIQAGDLIFYSSTASGRLSHVGIVTGVSYSGSTVTITTVEGNYSDQCATRRLTFTTSSNGKVSGYYVRGFACPNYKN